MLMDKTTVRDLINEVNNLDGGIFLPESKSNIIWANDEKNVCNFFDYLTSMSECKFVFRQGNRGTRIRRFTHSYKKSKIIGETEELACENDEIMICYYGQEKIQILYSCLTNSYNDKSLVYDLINQGYFSGYMLSKQIDKSKGQISIKEIFHTNKEVIDDYFMNCIEEIDEKIYRYNIECIDRNINYLKNLYVLDNYKLRYGICSGYDWTEENIKIRYWN